jgi:hypothetical protein
LYIWSPSKPGDINPMASSIDTTLPTPPERHHIFLKDKAPWVRFASPHIRFFSSSSPPTPPHTHGYDLPLGSSHFLKDKASWANGYNLPLHSQSQRNGLSIISLLGTLARMSAVWNINIIYYRRQDSMHIKIEAYPISAFS